MFFHGNVHCCRLVPWKCLFFPAEWWKPVHSRSWKANQSDLNSITTSSYHYCCAISIRRSVMQSESKDHHNSPHGVFAPWPLYLYLKVTVKQVHLTDNISVNIPLNLQLFIFIFSAVFFTFNARLWIYFTGKLIYMKYLMCDHMSFPVLARKCFVKEALCRTWIMRLFRGQVYKHDSW